MKKYISIMFLALFIFSSFGIGLNNVDAYVNVKEYTRKDGTVVKPYTRSNPNGLKYDNYGYKPSQGLYNPTYGTKGTIWDTPTWITDPDYYEGKALYLSNKSGGGTTYLNSNNFGYLKKGFSNDGIKELQTLLSNNGYDLGISDGKFGIKTKQAIIKFQIANKLISDGVMGPNTLKKINEVLN